ncbi:MAG: hypothetical protein P1V36_18345, partial [Planctomycetota bacterium]|nr:hypothetical protein [Planctomycetota bacterium]
MRRSLLLLTAGAVFLAAGLQARAGPKDEFLPPPPAADAAFYVANVATWVDDHCASCHRGEGGGAFRLVVPPDGMTEAQRRRADFDRILPFVNRRTPWESRIFLKVLDPGEGGDPHVGGSFFSSDDDMHDTVLDFVSGATPTNLPPEVWFEKSELRAKPKEEVVIDGRGSYDRDRDDMEKLAYWWSLYARPAESRVIVDDRRASRVTFHPDTGGTYVFTLRVGDGKVWSAPRAVTVEVFARVKREKSDPGGISGLEKADPQGLKRLRRLYLDVLGRSPTPAEAIAEERQGVRALVKNILLRAEMGRAWVEEASVRFGLFGDLRPVSDDAVDLALSIPAENLPPLSVERRPLAAAIARLLLGRAPTAAESLAAIALAEGQTVELPELGTVDSPRAWLVKVLDSRAFRRAAMLRRLERFLDSGDARKHIGRALN